MRQLFICLTFALGLQMQSQEANIPCQVQKSAIFKDEFKNSTIVSVSEDGNGGVVIARSYQGGMFNRGSHGYYFEHYDAAMNLQKEFEYELKDGYVIGMIMDKDVVRMIDFTYLKKEKAYVCSATSASINDFSFTTKELFRLDRDEVKSNINSYFGRGRVDGDSWANMIVNTDKNAFAITIDIDDKDAKKEMHKVLVYDASLNLKIEHLFKRDIKDRKFIYEGLDISSDGTTAYLLGKAMTTGAKKKKDGGRYQYELTRITNTDSKTQVFDTNQH